MHGPKQSKAKMGIHIYNLICFPFHHAEKENSDLWATYSLQQCRLWGKCFPALPLGIQILHLICSFFFLPVEQCSLNPLFSLWLFGGNTTSSASVLSMRMEPHLSVVQTDWNHSPSRAHDNFTPRHLLYFNWKYSFSFFPPANKGRSHLLHPCTVEAQQKTTLLHPICPKGFLFHGWSREVVAPFY